MRDRSGWHSKPSNQLKPHWPATITGFARGDLLDVELGLYLLETVMPTRRAIDVWTLLGGYPYAEAFGEARSEQQRLAIRRARHYLWDLRRRYAWQQAINAYCRVPEHLRGYVLDDETGIPRRRQPVHAAGRFALYDTLLSTPPAFESKPLPTAGAGEHWFPVRDRRNAVTFTDDFIGHVAPAHDLDALPPGEGKPIEVEWGQLEDAARIMDDRESSLSEKRRNHWVARLARVRLLVRDDAMGSFVANRPLRIEALLHLVGMVGAGKSTLRDVLTFWAAEIKKLNVTIVVGDVAEELAVVGVFRNLKTTATPIIGHSTRERHIQRLHRRLASTSTGSMLAHRHHGFDHLSSACPLDALRGLDGPRPLRISEAPCGLLFPVGSQSKSEPSTLETIAGPTLPVSSSTGHRAVPEPHGCPLWAQCPRQRGTHELVSSRIWVANPASLVHSGIPRQQHRERMRYLELAARRSDLIIIDEADRVQMLLDTAFAPTATLVGRSPDSWLDEVASKSIEALSRQGRAQLSEHTVNLWMAALDTVTAATNRLYAMLLSEDNHALLEWITEDYFSALTLHQWLMGSWFPELHETAEPPVDEADPASVRRAELRQRVSEVLNRFRDNPLRTTGGTDSVARKIDELVGLTLELLHSPDMGRTGTRVREALLDLLEGRELLAGDADPHDIDLDLHVTRFEFTLLLAALHHDLDVITMLWPTVEPALDLDSASNVLSRRPPKDYEPIIPESPMGNVLGFQFRLDERHGTQRSGELRFFRCSGVGRELLLSLGSFAAVDDRPAAHVLLMSATSWSGTSTRYHLHAPVGAVLRPHDKEVRAILGTVFRKQFLSWPPTSGRVADTNGTGTTPALRLSGTDPQHRPNVLREMLRQLAEPDRSLAGARSHFDIELDELAEIDPDRRRILVLTGSYSEAKTALDYLNTIPEWQGRVMRLVPDDADLDDAWQGLHRGDLTTFPTFEADILIAPLLAVERGHNIVVPGAGGKAAIGTVYFLARPHHRPDDMTLAIQAVNDWAVRQVRYGAFHQQALASVTPDRAGLDFRRLAAERWNHFLTRRMAWTSLNPEEKTAFTWDQLVLMWQVIGRLVRGGVPARVVFVDAAFSPREAGFTGTDTPATSLLASMREVLEPYFSRTSLLPSIDKSLVAALYEPLHNALTSMDI